jgi:hypothetical protein
MNIFEKETTMLVIWLNQDSDGYYTPFSASNIESLRMHLPHITFEECKIGDKYKHTFKSKPVHQVVKRFVKSPTGSSELFVDDSFIKGDFVDEYVCSWSNPETQMKRELPESKYIIRNIERIPTTLNDIDTPNKSTAIKNGLADIPIPDTLKVETYKYHHTYMSELTMDDLASIASNDYIMITSLEKPNRCVFLDNNNKEMFFLGVEI